MSMPDFFSNKDFKGYECKYLIECAIPRIKMLMTSRELQIQETRNEIANLLENGQEVTTEVLEYLVREENMMSAQELILLFCNRISIHLPIINTQRECPLGLKEAISSVCFAAPRCDLLELLKIQSTFGSIYGTKFLAAATEPGPNCCVNRQLIELLSVRALPAEKKLILLKEIAEEHGSTQYLSGSKVPLPKEKHEEALQSASSKVADEHSTKEEARVPSAPHPELNWGPLTDFGNLASQPSKGPEEEDTSLASGYEMPKPSEARQFLPLIPPLSPSSQCISYKETYTSFESVTRVESETPDPTLRSLPKVKSEMVNPTLQYLPKTSHSSVQSHDSDMFSTDFDGSAMATQSMPEHSGSSSSYDEAREQVNPHQVPQRMTSVENDTLGSYPNLLGPVSHSFKDLAHHGGCGATADILDFIAKLESQKLKAVRDEENSGVRGWLDEEEALLKRVLALESPCKELCHIPLLEKEKCDGLSLTQLECENCIKLVAGKAGTLILSVVDPYIRHNIKNSDWRLRFCATKMFRILMPELIDVDEKGLYELFEEGFNHILLGLEDEEDTVKSVSLLTLIDMFELLSSEFPRFVDEKIERIVRFLIKMTRHSSNSALKETSCLAIRHLCNGYQKGRRNSILLANFFPEIAANLLGVADESQVGDTSLRLRAYEALCDLVKCADLKETHTYMYDVSTLITKSRELPSEKEKRLINLAMKLILEKMEEAGFLED